jgi:hypothetical protein
MKCPIIITSSGKIGTRRKLIDDWFKIILAEIKLNNLYKPNIYDYDVI